MVKHGLYRTFYFVNKKNKKTWHNFPLMKNLMAEIGIEAGSSCPISNEITREPSGYKNLNSIRKDNPKQI